MIFKHSRYCEQGEMQCTASKFASAYDKVDSFFLCYQKYSTLKVWYDSVPNPPQSKYRVVIEESCCFSLKAEKKPYRTHNMVSYRTHKVVCLLRHSTVFLVCSKKHKQLTMFVIDSLHCNNN